MAATTQAPPKKHRAHSAGVNGAAAHVEALTGQAARQYSLHTRFMREAGMLLDIDASGTSLFHKPASWLELGLEDDDPRRARITRGTIALVGRERGDLAGRFRSAVERARQALRERAADLNMGSWRWMPFTAWRDFKARWDEISADVDDLRAEIIRDRAKLLRAVRPTFTEIAERTWTQMQTRRAKRGQKTGIVKIGGVEYRREAFIEKVVTEAIAAFPSREAIETGMTLRFRVAAFSSDSDIERENAEIAAAEAARAKARAAEEAELLKMDERRRQAQLRAWADEEKMRAEIAAMRQAKLEAFRRQMADDASSVAKVIQFMRDRLYQSVVKISADYQQHGKFLGKSAEKLATLINDYRMLNAGIEDAQLEKMLTELAQAVGPVGLKRQEGAARDTAKIEAAMNALMTELEQPVEQLLKREAKRFTFLRVRHHNESEEDES